MVGFCEVTQRMGVFGPDGANDEDKLPDYYPINGDVRFSPNIASGSSFKVVDAEGVNTIPAITVTAKIVNGILQHEDTPGVHLFAAGEGSNPEKITYTANYTNLRAGVVPVSLRDVTFEAIPGGTIDLGDVTPVAGTPGIGIVQGPPGAPGSFGREILLPEKFGAVRDGITDDTDALEAVIHEATSRGGGTILLQEGVYRISRPLGADLDWVRHTRIVGVGDFSSVIKIDNNAPVVAGNWFQSTIYNVILDAGNQGGPCIRAHLDKTNIEDCQLINWMGHGMILNTDYDGIGLLNRIRNNHIVQGIGYGIFTTYKFVDSWIQGNNIGSTEANISVEAGPLRILDNHLNGTPRHNIELRGNQRITINGNILEGSGEEAVIYRMPPWLTADAPQIQLTGNAFSNGGKAAPNTVPAIGIYGVAADKHVSGFSVVGNTFACQDHDAGWSYVADIRYGDNITFTGNQWGLGYSSSAPVRMTSDSTSVVSANAGGNNILQP